MRRTTIIRLALSLFLFILISLAFLPVALTRFNAKGQATDSKPLENGAMPALQGEEAIELLKEQGSYGSLAEAMSAIKYQATWQARPQIEGIGSAYEFKNAQHNLLAYIGTDGLQAAGLGEGKKSWRLGLRLKEYGY